MRTEWNQVYTRFSPEVAFEITPVHTCQAVRDQELESLKGRLLKEWLMARPEADLNAPVRRAANEAAALVWLTPYPLLLFPGLFEEKAKLAVARSQKQKRIRQRSAALVLENV